MKMPKKCLTVAFRSCVGLLLLFLIACNGNDDSIDGNNTTASSAVFLLIDEESIDNGNEPNDFSEVEVNDQLADIGLRQSLKFFRENIGQTIDLYTGQVGDEGWFAPKSIPTSWKMAGPSDNGTRNYFSAGPGLGSPTTDDNREDLLAEIPDVIPLRATGLTMLVGQKIYAVVYDSDISINYSPIKGNLKGANLGVIAFEILSVEERTDGSDSSLPKVKVKICKVEDIADLPLNLFSNAPEPQSSTEPFDIKPPQAVPDAELVDAP